MANGKFVAYYRVSTARQGASGLGLEAQKDAVRTHLNGGKWSLIGEETEVESGKRDERPKLSEALRLCRAHGATLIIAKLDRLSRNVSFISSVMESSVEFIAVDFPQANRLTIHILAAVAEHEREMISKRTKDALAAAKARGVKLGGYRWDIASQAAVGSAKGAAVRSAKAKSRAADLAPAIADIEASGATSLLQIAAGLEARGFTTPRGNSKWSATQVAHLLRNIDAQKPAP